MARREFALDGVRKGRKGKAVKAESEREWKVLQERKCVNCVCVICEDAIKLFPLSEETQAMFKKTNKKKQHVVIPHPYDPAYRFYCESCCGKGKARMEHLPKVSRTQQLLTLFWNMPSWVRTLSALITCR